MSLIRSVLFFGVASCMMPATTQAAESYDGCIGYIDSLPATVSTAGTWCLNKDLNTAVSSGAAITIASENVALDCNGFKLGGLAAGVTTSALGISSDRAHTSVRNCNIRGFQAGVSLSNGLGDLVEDNRLDGNTGVGISVAGDDSTIRRNVVRNTGPSAVVDYAYGIWVTGRADVLDNLVSGAFAYINDGPGSSRIEGIRATSNAAGTIAGNRVRGLRAHSASYIVAINVPLSGNVSIRDNNLIAGNVNGFAYQGIVCAASAARAKGNVINGFTDEIVNCQDDGNSL